MKAKIYQLQHGFEIATSAGALFRLVPTGSAFAVQDCGKVGEGWKGSGRLLKGIPNNIKRIFFKLNKKPIV